jgi:peptidoglycan/LPS O-acetylase OafA/YrhL
MPDGSVLMPKAANPWHSIQYLERFDLLDAFRGLAAISVVIHHVIGSRDPKFQIGQPAVMVFFVISGYCIACAVEACQRKGLGFAQFMWRRVRRIYPPYLLSLAFWAATRIFKWKLGASNDLTRSWSDWLQNITLTQWLTLLHHPTNYASKNPTLFVAAYWSLNYEEQFYFLFGLMLLAATVGALRVRSAISGFMLISLAWVALFPTLCYGLFIEYWAMFGVGALVFYRLCRLQTPAQRRLVDMVIVGLLILSISMRMVSPGGKAPMNWEDWIQPATRVAWGDLAIASAFAILLLLIRPLNDWYIRNRWLSLPFGSLGLITYSLYLVHQFNLKLASTVVTEALHIVRIDHPPILLDGILQCAVLIAVASVFWYFCERPFLNRSLFVSSSSSEPVRQVSA